MEFPKGLPRRYRRYWRQPWLRRASWSRGFRRWLDGAGLLTPNFSEAEARCKDGTPVPRHLKKKCRGHAFHLERVRHRLGDRPIPVTSWFRTPAHNVAVGGASRSKHMEAIATDHPKSWVDARGGQGRIRDVAVASNMGGVGLYPGGAVHMDSRPGPPVFWTSF
jgi:Peptidase M15